MSSDRVERITPSKKITFDVGNYGQKQGYAEHKGNPSFEKHLKREMADKDEKAGISSVESSAYEVNVSRATQSLFYSDDASVKELLKNIHEK